MAYLNSQKGKKAMLPLWLSPTQVRLAPLNEEYMDYAKQIAEEIDKNKIRVDIDDRNKTVGKKIRESETEWIPYTLVIGENEKSSGKYKVRIRETGEQKRDDPARAHRRNKGPDKQSAIQTPTPAKENIREAEIRIRQGVLSVENNIYLISKMSLHSILHG